MAKNNEVEVLGSTEIANNFLSDMAAAPIDLMGVLQEMKLVGPHVKPDTLIGDVFNIYGARRIESDMQEEGHYYFCKCLDPSTGEIFTTSLGGQAIMDLLDAIFTHGPGQPVQVKLGFLKQGKYDGYYVFEPIE